MKIEPIILKGFRDFLPKEVRKRQYVIETLKRVFESYGFEPLETPALEYAEILEGKYGDEGEKLMYKFKDLGERIVALRYDQTIPLARVVAKYRNELPLPFKRYQIQNVWRAENPQAGRFREFLQCDIDTVGTSSLLADAEIIEVAIECIQTLGFKKFKVLINDRNMLRGIIKDQTKLPAIIRALDKIKKIGREKVLLELKTAGLSENESVAILSGINAKQPTDDTKTLFKFLKRLGVSEKKFKFTPFLARGLDYYTGIIFEIDIEDYDAGSVCGGGRYDDLVGMFGNQTVPAVGCSFGFDRLIEAMEQQNLFKNLENPTKVLVTVFSPELLDKSVEVCEILAKQMIPRELYVDENAKMDRQLKYADQKGIPYVVIIGPKEAESNSATVKNLETGEQKTAKLEQIVKMVE